MSAFGHRLKYDAYDLHVTCDKNNTNDALKLNRIWTGAIAATRWPITCTATTMTSIHPSNIDKPIETIHPDNTPGTTPSTE